MRYITLITLISLLFVGCASDTYKLDPQYDPLKEIRQGTIETVGLKDTGARTIGTTMWVKDLDKWLEDREPGSTRFHAIVTHEQTHARRQQEQGLSIWIGRYLTDADFAWKEEQIGWYRQIVILIGNGYVISPEGIALTLSNYRVATGSIVSYGDALRWVYDVMGGRWKPEGE